MTNVSQETADKRRRREQAASAKATTLEALSTLVGVGKLSLTEALPLMDLVDRTKSLDRQRLFQKTLIQYMKLQELTRG